VSKSFYLSLGKTVQWPDFPGNFPPAGSLTYDDVLLVPQTNTELKSRKDALLVTEFGPWKLEVPVISAPMDTVSGLAMIRKLHELGAVGTLPRNKDFQETLDLCEKISKEKLRCVYALGLHNTLEEVKLLQEKGAEMILFDVANGGMKEVARMAGEIKKELGLWVMAGNIVTYSQSLNYKEAGIDAARVGVGAGSVCKTRLVAGSGFPQLSAILETSETGMTVIADGGIRYPGDVAKALAAGAKMVMLGSMLAGTEETPGDVVNGMKEYRGQASGEYMQDNGVKVNGFRAVEGVVAQVQARGSVSEVIDEVAGGLRSAMSYAGARTLDEFRKKAVFEIVSDSTKIENQPTALMKK
jgi:IMP dehydrogenase